MISLRTPSTSFAIPVSVESRGKWGLIIGSEDLLAMQSENFDSGADLDEKMCPIPLSEGASSCVLSGNPSSTF